MLLPWMWKTLEILAWLLVGEALVISPWPLCAATLVVAILMRAMHKTVSEALS